MGVEPSTKCPCYAPEHGADGQGDLYLPAALPARRLALVIHGGSWVSMERGRMAGICVALAEMGWAACTIDYRLAKYAPWPACGDDCLQAAEYLLDAPLDGLAPAAERRLVVLGASAGGHLALMTGLRVRDARVVGIVSMAGQSDLWRMTRDEDVRRVRGLFGGRDPSPSERTTASPVAYVWSGAPPLLLMHSDSDKVVLAEHAEAIAQRYALLGVRAEHVCFAGTDHSHSIWAPGSMPPQLIPALETRLQAFLDRVTMDC